MKGRPNGRPFRFGNAPYFRSCARCGCDGLRHTLTRESAETCNGEDGDACVHARGRRLVCQSLVSSCMDCNGFGERRYRSARHGLVPYRRPHRRDQRQAGARHPAPARRPDHQVRSERPVHGRADVRAVFPAEEPQGKAAAADVAWRRADRRHLREHARRPRRLAQHVRALRLGRLQFRRGRARTLGLRAAGGVAERADLPALSGSVRALPHRRRTGSWNPDPAKAQGHSRQPVPGRSLRELHAPDGAALAVDR